MKKLVLVLSTIFATASSDPADVKKEGQEGITAVVPVISGAVSGAAAQSANDVSSSAVEEQQDALATTPADKEAEKQRKIRIAFLNSYPRAHDGVDFVVSALVIAYEGFKDKVLPHVLTFQFASGLGAGFAWAYLAQPSCK